jgi:carboxyl-terminal processing protease
MGAKRLKTTLLIFLGILLFAGTFGTGFATATVINRHLNPTAEEADAFALFWETWRLVERDFYGDVPDETQRTYGAIRGSLATLNDPYTLFVEPQPREMERDSLQGMFGGIGAFVTQNEEGQFLLEPIDAEQPAAVAGVLVGDTLLAIDGRAVTAEMTVEDVVIAIRGPVGDKVTLTLLHPGETTPVDIEVTRAIIELPSAAWQILEQDPTIGHIQLSRFTERSAEEIETAIQELTADGADKLILDLRHNGGGLLDSAVEVLDHFLDGDVVLYEQQAGEEEESIRTWPGGIALDTPLVILVDGATASASEIVAGALQDLERAPLVGERTFGKGSVQHIYDLSDGSSLHVTSARWYTPSRQPLDGQGLEPTYLVSPDESGEDLQLARAIQVLQSGQ